MAGYISQKLLRYRAPIKNELGGISEWLDSINYEPRTAPFLENLICVYSEVFAVLTLVVVLLTGISIMIYGNPHYHGNRLSGSYFHFTR